MEGLLRQENGTSFIGTLERFEEGWRDSGKKEQMDELKSELKSPAAPIEFSSNIDLVVKNYDRLNALMSLAP